MEEQLHKWILWAAGLLMAYMSSFIGILVLFLTLFCADFISGFAASLLSGHRIESYKLRWSFVKTLCYFGTFGFTALIGVCTGDMGAFMKIMNLEMYVALWIEAVSITENMMRIFPKVLFIEYIHYMISIEWVKKLSGLNNFLKEKEKKE